LFFQRKKVAARPKRRNFCQRKKLERHARVTSITVIFSFSGHIIGSLKIYKKKRFHAFKKKIKELRVHKVEQVDWDQLWHYSVQGWGGRSWGSLEGVNA
jgi:hypothetical protein